jgi:hypothetical protein
MMADDEQPADGSGEGPAARPPAERVSPAGRQGSMRVQNPETSTPRPPTVAEARQRDKARKEREAAEELAAAQELARQRRAARQKKVLMGSVAVVGVAGIIAMGYMASDRDREVSATCVKDGTDEVVPDQYCSSGTGGVGGIFIWAGSPYRYYYGGTNGGVGTIARGGTLELPKNAVGRTSAGSTITRGKGSGVSITRGGFGSGSSSHGSSGG